MLNLLPLKKDNVDNYYTIIPQPWQKVTSYIATYLASTTLVHTASLNTVKEST